jgi:hypothetical protein
MEGPVRSNEQSRKSNNPTIHTASPPVPMPHHPLWVPLPAGLPFRFTPSPRTESSREPFNIEEIHNDDSGCGLHDRSPGLNGQSQQSWPSSRSRANVCPATATIETTVRWYGNDVSPPPFSRNCHPTNHHFFQKRYEMINFCYIKASSIIIEWESTECL